MENLLIRQAQVSDLQDMQQLFVDTIKEICSVDYAKDQIEAWTSSIENQDRWERLVNQQYCLVAVIDQTIVGLAALDDGDYLDFLYVHKDYQRRGIANKLFEAIKLESLRQGFYKMRSDVSITARPYFESKGFEVTKENKVILKGVELINYRMKEV